MKKILCLGDSITHGYPSYNTAGYRGFLMEEFNVLPTLYQFVGSQVDTDPTIAQVIPGHEGRNSWMALDWLGQSLGQAQQNTDPTVLPNIIATYQPDIVILLSGICDVTGGNATPVTAAAAPDSVETIIDMFLATGAWVINGTIPSNNAYPTDVFNAGNFNQALRIADWKKRSQGKKVVLVDTAAAIGQNLADQWHPNYQGYQNMANAWLPAVLPLLTMG